MRRINRSVQILSGPNCRRSLLFTTSSLFLASVVTSDAGSGVYPALLGPPDVGQLGRSVRRRIVRGHRRLELCATWMLVSLRWDLHWRDDRTLMDSAMTSVVATHVDRAMRHTLLDEPEHCGMPCLVKSSHVSVTRRIVLRHSGHFIQREPFTIHLSYSVRKNQMRCSRQNRDG